MSSPFHLLWRRLCPAGPEPQPSSGTYRFDPAIQQAVQELATREGRPEEEVAGELLASGLALRKQAEAYVQAWAGLTAREKQITVLLCQDYTYRQIATVLFISLETVKSHSRGILKKLGLRNKLDLMRNLGHWDFSEWKHDQ
jgi:DNA-binding CsgD family transcriptional regulator